MKHRKSSLASYYDTLRKSFAVVTLIIISLTIVGSAFQFARYAWFDRTGIYSYGPSLFTSLVPLITIGGGFAAGMLTTIGQSLPRSERIIRAGALGILCNLLYVPLFEYVLMFTFRWYGIQGWLSYAGPFVMLLITVILAIVGRRFRKQGGRIVMIGFAAVVLLTLASSFFQSIRYDVASSLFGLIPLGAAILFFALVRPVGRLVRTFYSLYIAILIIFGTIAASYFVWDDSFNATSYAGIAAIVVALVLLVASLYILIRLRIVTKR